MKKLGLLILLSLLSAACSKKYLSTGEEQYLQSRNGPDIIVPPPLTSTNISHFYDLASQQQNAQVSLDPPIEKGFNETS